MLSTLDQELRLRLRTACLLILALILILSSGSLVFTLVSAFALFVVSEEWGRICTLSLFTRLFVSLLQFALFYFYVTQVSLFHLIAFPYMALWAAIVCLICLQRKRLSMVLPYWMWVGAGLCILPMSLSSLVWIYSHHFYMLLWLIVLIVLCDSTAYLGGKRWGTIKMMPAISPGKSYAGFCTALSCAIIYGIVTTFLSDLPLLSTCFLSSILMLAAFFGDAFESWLKRAHDVKDSSNWLPGHGGLLDRLDSFLFSAPCIMFWFLT